MKTSAPATLIGQTTAPLSSERSPRAVGVGALQFVHPTRMWLPLDRDMVFGREGTVPLSGAAVSRRHAEVSTRGGAVGIRDLGSTNGVFVDGRRVQAERLETGMVVRLGDHVALVTPPGSGVEPTFAELLPGLFGGSVLRGVVQSVPALAATECPLVILGESGTGKEVVARAIHGDARRPFVAVNCGALPPSLAEAELFGHQRGAFTGADAARLGLVRSAAGGTLFLDELAELPLLVQARLLRFLQDGEVLALGAERPVHVRVRVMAATNRDLRALVETGAFRLDLYHRLAGLFVELPPLRERKEDVVPLFEHFLSGELGVAPELSPAFVEALCLHSWPGNVRELQHLARALCVVARDAPRWRRALLPREILDALKLPAEPELAAAEACAHQPPLRPRQLSPEQVERALLDAEGNVSRAATSLGLSRQRLYTLLQEHGLSVESFRSGAKRGRGAPAR